jgi:VIT1/CCC1 family predicted Fe2+/Mn2+ transporter
MSAKKKFWLAGLALAIIGVLLARVISRHYDQAAFQLVMFAVGTLLALAGLGLIMLGIRKK